MSTIAYGILTRKRLDASKDVSLTATSGLGTGVDALTALVPAEVLAAQALILSVTTSTPPASVGSSVPVPKIPASSTGPLKVAFFGLIVVSVVLYGVGFRPSKGNVRWFAAGLIPPIAFVAWSMIYSPSTFSAVAPHMDSALRTVIAILLAIVLPVIAGALAGKLNNSDPPGSASTPERSTANRATTVPAIPTDPDATQVRGALPTGANRRR